MKRLVIDIDNTICRTKNGQYHESEGIEPIRKQLVAYRKAGFEIVLFSSRNMRSYEGNLGKINANTLPTLVRWLDANEVPYDEIYMGKPWCGTKGFYVDDKAIRPDEFARMSYEEIRTLLDVSSQRLSDHAKTQE